MTPQAVYDARWKERAPEAARASNLEKCRRYKADPGVRETERIKAIARRHGLTYAQALARDAARRGR